MVVLFRMRLPVTGVVPSQLQMPPVAVGPAPAPPMVLPFWTFSVPRL
jgi:hypothetical protein